MYNVMISGKNSSRTYYIFVVYFNMRPNVREVFKLIKVSRCTLQVFYVTLIGLKCFARINNFPEN